MNKPINKPTDKIKMMKKLILIFMLVALAVGGCYSQKKGKKRVYSVSKTANSAKSASSSVPSLDASGNLIVKREHVERKYSSRDSFHGRVPNEIDVTIDMPVGNSSLALSVKKRIAQWLFRDYCVNDDAVDLEKMAKNSTAVMFQTLVKLFNKYKSNTSYYFSIEKVFETSKFVSFKIEGFENMGDGQGEDYAIVGGTTIRKSDGKVMDECLVKNSPALTALIFKGITEGDMSVDRLMPEFRDGNIPMPKIPPYVTKDGVVFAYLTYEITGARQYLPQAIIPLNTIYPYLTDEAKELLKYAAL